MSGCTLSAASPRLDTAQRNQSMWVISFALYRTGSGRETSRQVEKSIQVSPSLNVTTKCSKKYVHASLTRVRQNRSTETNELYIANHERNVLCTVLPPLPLVLQIFFHTFHLPHAPLQLAFKEWSSSAPSARRHSARIRSMQQKR
jgi:hypothetical protein